jgi:hypothetical protein
VSAAHRGERLPRLALHAGNLLAGADVERLAAGGAEGARLHDRLVAVEREATTQHERDVFDAGADDRAEVGALRSVEDGDVGDVAGAQRADGVCGAGGHRCVLGDHAPELEIAEVLAEVLLVELVGTTQFSQDVHRAGGHPVGAEGDRDREAIDQRHRSGVAVERDVGAGRPDDRSVIVAHPREVARAHRDRVHDRGLRGDDVVRALHHGVRIAGADELVAGLGVDALGDVRQVAVEVGDVGSPRAVLRVVAVVRATRPIGVAEREGVAVGGPRL